jgi:hypothetical protein
MQMTKFAGKDYYVIHKGKQIEYVIPEKYASYLADNLKNRIDSCGKLTRIKRKCYDCGNEQEERIIRQSCYNRFCEKCATVRFRKAYSRLSNYKIDNDYKMIHAVIGFEEKGSNFSRDYKKSEESVIKLFFKRLKESGVNAQGIKIFDYQDEKHIYSHYHLALMQHYKLYDLRHLMNVREQVIKETGTKFIFRVLNYQSPWARLKRYFSKRIAGLYGDNGRRLQYINGNGQTVRLHFGFTLADKMCIEGYIEKFYGLITKTRVGTRLSCITITPVRIPICKNCNSTDTFLAFDQEFLGTLIDIIEEYWYKERFKKKIPLRVNNLSTLKQSY